MEDTFQLPVVFNDRKLLLDCRFARYGYSYRIYVQLDEQEIIFEPDEERNFRALIDGEKAKTPNRLLLAAVADALEEAFR